MQRFCRLPGFLGGFRKVLPLVPKTRAAMIVLRGISNFQFAFFPIEKTRANIVSLLFPRSEKKRSRKHHRSQNRLCRPDDFDDDDDIRIKQVREEEEDEDDDEASVVKEG